MDRYSVPVVGTDFRVYQRIVDVDWYTSTWWLLKVMRHEQDQDDVKHFLALFLATDHGSAAELLRTMSGVSVAWKEMVAPDLEDVLFMYINE